MLGGAVAEQVIPGLGDAGTVTRWGLPFARLTMDLARNDDGFTKTPLLPVPCEMPRTDDRYQGQHPPNQETDLTADHGVIPAA